MKKYIWGYNNPNFILMKHKPIENITISQQMLWLMQYFGNYACSSEFSEEKVQGAQYNLSK